MAAASAQPAAFSVVSAANYRTVVAPDSLASIFGSGLATSVASAQLDASGQLPTQLGGTTVQVNGESAGLIYVSPAQINFLVPADIATGTADVAVRAGAGTALHATVQIANTAPALFSLDASGSGPGAILNAVTYAPAPFFVETPETAGSDKRTRLSLYGTGIRYAGNPTHDATVNNVASQITAQTENSTGPNFKLNVEYAGIEYAGAAPGFFGLDQINIILPPDLDGAGTVSLAITAEDGSSNIVTIQVGSLPASSIRLTSLGLSASTVTGGGSVTGTMSLNAPARVSGVIVTLRSSNIAAQPPLSVIIPAGQVSATFNVATNVLAATQNVTITAQAGAASQTATLEVDAPNAVRLASFAVSPPAVQGGANFSATATLTGPAPAGGASIQLASDNGAVKPPATLTVPFGQTSATIAIPTAQVTTMQTANISANFAGGSQTATVTVNPPFTLSLSASTVTGGASVTGTIALPQPAPLLGLTISLKASDASVQVPPLISIAPGQSSVTFTVNTTPVPSSRAVTISAASPSFAGFTQAVSLAVNPVATAALSSLTISPTKVTGGSTASGTVTLTAPAPVTGFTVTLKTNAPFYTQIPPTVMVPGGQTTASFQIGTASVPSTQTVTITAANGGVSKAATLTIQ